MKKLVLCACLLLFGTELYAAGTNLYVSGRMGVGTGNPGAQLDVYNFLNPIWAAKFTSPYGPGIYVTAGQGQVPLQVDKAGAGTVLKIDENNNLITSGVLTNTTRSISPFGSLSILGTKGVDKWGGINFRDESNNNIGTLMMQSNYSGFFNAADTGWRFLVDNAGNGYFPGTVSSSSDIKLKKNINKISHSLDKIKAINGYYYHWKDETRGTNRHIGVIAQEVEKEFPELVTEVSNPVSEGTPNPEKTKAVAYPQLVAVLLQAVKELDENNANLKQRVEELERFVSNHR